MATTVQANVAEPPDAIGQLEEGPASAPTEWRLTNQRYLQSGIDWIRDLLESLVGGRPTRDAAFLTASATWAQPKPEPAAGIELLAETFGLARVERDVLLACAAHELDGGIRDLCSRVQSKSGNHISVDVLQQMFGSDAWTAMAPAHALRWWRFIELTIVPGTPFALCPLRIDERILNFIKGVNHVDDRLAAVVQPVLGNATLPRSQLQVADAIAKTLEAADLQGRLPVIELAGSDRVSKRLVAAHACGQLGLKLWELPFTSIPAPADAQHLLLRLWEREGLLARSALYVTGADDSPAAASFVARASRGHGVILVDAGSIQAGAGAYAATFHVQKPSAVEQAQEWRRMLGDDRAALGDSLAGHFNLNVDEIARVASGFDASNGAGAEHLWTACVMATRPRLGSFVRRIEPKASWDDLVLPATAVASLRQLADQVPARYRVYDGFRFRDKQNRGFGISALFAGESGTGKTMAAEVIAAHLHLDLYRIDLAGVVSKYIGETEKNLREIFDAAEDGGSILFFDEADALFGKRSEVKDSHDRYANIEINYLLQRMEAYSGVAILATNMREALDSAFVRRLRFIVHFPFPRPIERQAIWERTFPAGITADLDLPRLAEFNLSGGSIANVAVNAAFLAATSSATRVDMSHVLHAVQDEMRKLDRRFSESDFSEGING